MLATFFSLYKDLFSRAFWLGNVLPVLIFAATHAAIASAVFPDRVSLTDWLAGDDAGRTAKLLSVALAALVVLAWTLAPLMPLFRGLLDGPLLPFWLWERLRRERIRAWSNPRFEQATRLADQWQDLPGSARDHLIEARSQAQHPDNLALTADRRAELHDQAAAAVDRLCRTKRGQVPPLDDAGAAIAALAQALAAGAARHGDFARLVERLRTAANEARMRRDARAARFGDDPALYFNATRIGDVRQRTQSYSSDVYGVDFDDIWPRLQLYLTKDDPLTQRLGDAQAIIDFGILSLVLAITVPAIWLPLMILYPPSPWLVLALGAGLPTALAANSEFIVQAEIAFGKVVETAIDKYRLAVLTDLLRQPPPRSRAAERAAWRGVHLANDPHTAKPLDYWAPTK